MADAVEVSLALGDLVKVKVGDKYFLSSKYRTGNILTEGIYKTRDLVCGIHTFFHILIAADNKASSFYRYMTEGTLEVSLWSAVGAR